MDQDVQLKGVLSADIVAYTKHLQNAEQKTIENWENLLRSYIEPLIEQNHGTIFKETGDGFLASFPATSKAVKFATEFQRMIVSEYPLPADTPKFSFRIGISLGDISKIGEDYHGLGVVHANRCQAACEKDEICVSSAVFDTVKHDYATGFFRESQTTFKNEIEDKKIYIATILSDTDISTPQVEDEEYNNWEINQKSKKIQLSIIAFLHNINPKIWLIDVGLKGIILNIIYYFIFFTLCLSGYWISSIHENVNLTTFHSFMIVISCIIIFLFLKYYEQNSVSPFRNSKAFSESSFTREDLLRRAASMCNIEDNAGDSAFWKTLAHSIRGEVSARLPETKSGTINASIMVFTNQECSTVRVLAQTDRQRHSDPQEEFPCLDLLGYHAARRGNAKVLEDVSTSDHPFRRTSLERNKLAGNVKIPGYRCIFAMPIFLTKEDSSINPDFTVGFIIVDSDRPYHFALNRGDRLQFSLYPFSTLCSVVLKEHPYRCQTKEY